MTSVFDRKENIVGKGENAGYQHFLLFPRCFQKASFLGVVISRDCVVILSTVLPVLSDHSREVMKVVSYNR